MPPRRCTRFLLRFALVFSAAAAAQSSALAQPSQAGAGAAGAQPSRGAQGKATTGPTAAPAPAPGPSAAGGAGPSANDLKNASARFAKGTELFAAQKYALALEELRASYAAVPSPNSRLYIARCLAALGDTRDAYLELEKVAAEAEQRGATEPKYLPTRDTALLERDELAQSLGLVTVRVTGGDAAAAVSVGGADLPRERWDKPYPVAPGSVEVVVRIPPRQPLRQTVSLAAGQKRDVVFDTSPPPPPPALTATKADTSSGDRKWLRPYAYVAGGVGAVGLVMFTVAGAMTHATYSDLEETCGAGPCPPGHEDDVSAGRTQQTVANVGLALGVVGVATGVTLFVLSSTGGSGGTQAKDAALRVGPTGASLTGRF